jgi:hypothetical protein
MYVLCMYVCVNLGLCENTGDVCVYVCMYLCPDMCMYVYVYACTLWVMCVAPVYRHIHAYISKRWWCMCVYTCTHWRMYMFQHLQRIHISMNVLLCMPNIHTYACTCSNIRKERIHIGMHVLKYVSNIHVHTHMRMCECLQCGHIGAKVSMCLSTHVHLHTCTHLHIHSKICSGLTSVWMYICVPPIWRPSRTFAYVCTLAEEPHTHTHTFVNSYSYVMFLHTCTHIHIRLKTCSGVTSVWMYRWVRTIWRPPGNLFACAKRSYLQSWRDMLG